MLSLLKKYNGAIEINGVKYPDVNTAIRTFKASDSAICIRLSGTRKTANKTQITATDNTVEKCITVKAYMTRPGCPEFDFMTKYNNDIPMPLRTMVGTVENETPGMVYMKLHGDIVHERTMRCLCCDKVITNPVSQYFGMGPKCGGHNYVNPFYSREELEAAVKDYRTNYLRNITWEGWIIKSAIISEEVVKQ